MSTDYPEALDEFTNPPSPATPLGSSITPHREQHANANDAIEAIEAKLGTGASLAADAAPGAALVALGDGDTEWVEIDAATDATTLAKGIVRLAGDLGGTAASPSVLKIRGVAVGAAAPTAGQVLTAVDGDDATWQNPSGGGASVVERGRAKPSGGAAELVIPGNVLFAVATGGLSAGLTQYERFLLEDDVDVDAYKFEVTTPAAAGGKARVAIATADKDWQPLALVAQSAEIAIDSAGVKSFPDVRTLAAGRYLKIIRVSAACDLRGYRANMPGEGIPSTMGVNMTRLRWRGEAYGAFTDPPAPWTGTSTDTNTLTLLHHVVLSVTAP